jgi:hypothetical protein
MEYPMTIKTKIAALAVAALTVAGGIASTTTAAQAGGGGGGFHPGWGFGAGLVGAAIVGSAIAASTPAPYYRSCLVRQYDAFGRYIGTVNVCY